MLFNRSRRLFVIGMIASASLNPRTAVASPTKAKQLVTQGEAALATQDFDAARQAFLEAQAADPRNVAATSGLGLAYAGLKNYVKAGPLLDRAVALRPNDRYLVYSAAAVDIDGANAMRATKLLKDYLEAHSTPLDEPLANALAVALGKADEQAWKNGMYQLAASFYKTYNGRLEAASPGMKRWGVEWISAADYADKQTDIASKQTQLDDANKSVAESDRELASLKSKLSDLQRRVQDGSGSQDAVDDLKHQIDEEQDKLTKATADRDSLLGSIPRPTLPTTLEYVTADAMPNASGQSQAVGENAAPQTAVDPPIIAKGVSGQHDDTPPATDAPADAPADGAPEKPPAKPTILLQYAAAFPVAPDLLVTSAATLSGATKTDLLNADGNSMAFQLVRSDDATGLALLRLTGQKMSSYLPLADDFNGGPVQCAALMKANIFNPTAEMVNGTAPAPADKWKIHLSRRPRLPGAPLLVSGKVIGVQLVDPDSTEDALPAATLSQLKAFLGADLPTTPGKATATDVMIQVSATKGSN